MLITCALQMLCAQLGTISRCSSFQSLLWPRLEIYGWVPANYLYVMQSPEYNLNLLNVLV